MIFLLGVVIGCAIWYFWVENETKNFLSRNNMERNAQNIRRVK